MFDYLFVMKYLLMFMVGVMIFFSCYKDCAKCVKTVQNVTSSDTIEVREVCDNKETVQLEMSSSGTVVWDC